MALAGTGPVLGAALATAAGSTDVAGVSAWLAVANVLAAQLPAYIGTFNPTGGTPLVVVAGLVTGRGTFTTVPGAGMGPLLAAAAGSVDSVGISKWAAIGQALTDWISAHAGYDIGLFAYTGPGSGPTTGAGIISFDDLTIGPSLAAAAGSTDAIGIAKWATIGSAILTTIHASALITPVALVNPGAGGAVTGTSTIS